MFSKITQIDVREERYGVRKRIEHILEKEGFFKGNSIYSLKRANYIEYFPETQVYGYFYNYDTASTPISAKEFFEMYKQYKSDNMEKVIIGGIELKPGMLICLDEYTPGNNAINWYIVFPIKLGLAAVSYREGNSWDIIEGDFIKRIVAIRSLSNGCSITDGNLLWQKPEEVVLTMQEIADKFNIPVEQLKIKK